TCAVPLASGLGANVNTPAASIDRGSWNRPALSFVSAKLTVRPGCGPATPSFTGPVLIALAQFGTRCCPLSSVTFWSGPRTKVGGSLEGVTLTVTVAESL